MKKTGRAVAVALTLLACSCGGGSNDNGTTAGTPARGGGCIGSFSGAALVTSSTANCALCSVQDPNKSIDGDANTYAGITYSPAGGTVTVRAMAQPGIVFPAGNQAGALMAFPNSASASNSLLITTYLSGAKQEQGSGFSNIVGSDVLAGPKYYRFPTSKPFDAVEASIARQGTVDAEAVKIFEFCSQ